MLSFETLQWLAEMPAGADRRLVPSWLDAPLHGDELSFRPVLLATASAAAEARPASQRLHALVATGVLRLKANAGETAATDAGLKSVRGRYVVVMDVDLQNDPHDIPGMLAHLDQWDAVTGWRVNRAAGDSWVRRISSRIANGVRNKLSDETVQDSGCTFRAFRRECLRDLVLYRGLHRFIPTLLKMRGFRVLEVPVNHRPRRFGQSKYGIGNRAVRALVDLLAVRWMKDRLLRYEVAESRGGEEHLDR